jgi:hypothetical protein
MTNPLPAPRSRLRPATAACQLGGEPIEKALVRWERKAENYLAMVHLASGLIAFQQAHVF